MIRCGDADSLLVSGAHAPFSGGVRLCGVARRYMIDVDDIAARG
jgi:hypothetical protein